MNDSQSAAQSASSEASTAPAPFAATSLSVSLTASDLSASAQWYRDVLGFTIDREFERNGARIATRLRAGSVELLLTQDNGAQGANRAKGEGFSISLTTRQNIDELAARAKSHGATLDTEPADVMGMRVFRLRDPDGFRLVISTERPA